MYSDIENFIRGSADQELEKRTSKPISIRHHIAFENDDEIRNSFEDVELNQRELSQQICESSSATIHAINSTHQDAASNATIYNCLLTLIVFASSLPMVNMQILFLRTSRFVNVYTSLQYALLVSVSEITWVLTSAIGYISIKAVSPSLEISTIINSSAASRSIMATLIVTILSSALYILILPIAATTTIKEPISWSFCSVPFSMLVLSRALLGISAAVAQYFCGAYVSLIHLSQFSTGTSVESAAKVLVQKMSLFHTFTRSYLPVIAGTVLLWTKPPTSTKTNLINQIFNFFTAEMWLAISLFVIYGVLFLLYHKRIDISPSAFPTIQLPAASLSFSDHHRSRKSDEKTNSAVNETCIPYPSLLFGLSNTGADDVNCSNRAGKCDCSNCESAEFYTAYSDSPNKQRRGYCSAQHTSIFHSEDCKNDIEEFKIEMSANFSDKTDEYNLKPSINFATMHSLRFLDLQNFGSSDSSSSNSSIISYESDGDNSDYKIRNSIKGLGMSPSRQERDVRLIVDRWSGQLAINGIETDVVSPECGSATSNELFSFNKEQIFLAYLTNMALVLNLIDFLVQASVWGFLWNLFAIAYAYGIITSNIDQSWRLFVCAAIGGGIGMSLRLESIIACCGRYRCSAVYNEHVACIVVGLILILTSFGMLIWVEETAGRVSSEDKYNRYISYSSALLLLAIGHSWYIHSSEILYRIVLNDIALLSPWLRIINFEGEILASHSVANIALRPSINCPTVFRQREKNTLMCKDQWQGQFCKDSVGAILHWCYGRIFTSMTGRIAGILFSTNTLKFEAPLDTLFDVDKYKSCQIPWIVSSTDQIGEINAAPNVPVCVVLNLFGWGLVSFLMILSSCIFCTLFLYFHYKLSRRAEVAPTALKRPNSSNESVY